MFFHTAGCPLGGLCCGQELSGIDQEWSGKLFLKNSFILLDIPDQPQRPLADQYNPQMLNRSETDGNPYNIYLTSADNNHIS